MDNRLTGGPSPASAFNGYQAAGQMNALATPPSPAIAIDALAKRSCAVTTDLVNRMSLLLERLEGSPTAQPPGKDSVEHFSISKNLEYSIKAAECAHNLIDVLIAKLFN